jgi:NAD(P)-dependent dehydrogenase (short-subunit alcohol dehydrogenase family)
VTVAGKVAVVTGVTAVEGLGHSVARVFAREGARVVGNGRRLERGQDVEREIRGEGGDFTFVQGDVRRVEDCRRLIEATVERYGRVDVLINNAPTIGEHPFARSHEITEADWDTCIDTMLKGSFFCSRFALPHMIAQHSGVILNIASVVGMGVWTYYRAYGAAKAGVFHFSAGMAEEYKDTGVRVHAIIMSGVRSDAALFSHEQQAVGLPEAERQAFIQRMVERARDPDEVARELAVIAGDISRWPLGEAIRVPGAVQLSR